MAAFDCPGGALVQIAFGSVDVARRFLLIVMLPEQTTHKLSAPLPAVTGANARRGDDAVGFRFDGFAVTFSAQ